MRLIKSVTLSIICLLLVSSVLFVEIEKAQAIATNSVEASFDIEIISATDLKVDCEVTTNIIKVESSEITYSSSDIEENYTNGNEILLGVIGGQLQTYIKETLRDSFENAEIIPQNDYPVYENGKFHDTFNINLTPSYFGINEGIDAYSFLNGILDLGAHIGYTFNFKAMLGWSNIYAINLGENYDFQKQNNGTWDGNTLIEWPISNINDVSKSKSGTLVIKDKYPTTLEAEEDIFLDFQLNATGKNTILQANILANSIAVQDYMNIPDFVTNINFLTADGIRLLVSSGLFSWEDVYENTIKPVQQEIKSNIETKSFNQTLALNFNWDSLTTTNATIPYELQNMNKEPAVGAVLEDDSINLEIFDISARGLFGLINTGAVGNASKNSINFGEKINEMGYDYSISLSMPPDVTFNEDNPFTWNDTIDFKGTVLSEESPEYSEEDVLTIIEIDVATTDLNLLSFFTGQTELIFGLDLKETTNYNITKYKDKFNLNKRISLDYINSDALRLCVEEDIFTDDQIDLFLANEKNGFEENMKTILEKLEIKAHIDEDIFYDSLTWEGNINNMDAENPVTTSSYAYSSYPTDFDLSILLPSFEISEQTYTFSGIENQTVIYRMIFPDGISIDVDDNLEKSEVKETSDGRNYIEVVFSPEESNLTLDVSCDINPSLMFILGTLMPCFITLFILIILVAIIIMFRRRRKKRKAVIVEEAPTYQEDDYYVPPPPNSK